MRFLRVLSVACASTIGLWSMFVPPNNAPVERLVANVGEYVKGHPEDAKGYYRLGRIHYLAFALDAASLQSYGRDDTAQAFNQQSPGRAISDGQKHQTLPSRERAAHLEEALRLLQKAVEMEPNDGLYLLGLACVYEDGHAISHKDGWREQAISTYLAAWQKSATEDQKLTYQPITGINNLISFEAGNSYIRLVTERGIHSPQPFIADTDVSAQLDEAATIKRIQAHLAALKNLPPAGIVTPVVLSLRPHSSLSDLLAPDTRVGFDLDGTGRSQSYSWLRPDAALLVWDPDHTGHVTSGRQLFGNVTWWMFWDNGYQALAALDDDHDGWLRGRELAGLSLWFDRNQNGVSDPGEVITVEQAGIEALATTVDGRDGDSPMNARGVRLRNGQILPSWDWVATPPSSVETISYARKGQDNCRQKPWGGTVSASPYFTGLPSLGKCAVPNR